MKYSERLRKGADPVHQAPAAAPIRRRKEGRTKTSPLALLPSPLHDKDGNQRSASGMNYSGYNGETKLQHGGVAKKLQWRDKRTVTGRRHNVPVGAGEAASVSRHCRAASGAAKYRRGRETRRLDRQTACTCRLSQSALPPPCSAPPAVASVSLSPIIPAN